MNPLNTLTIDNRDISLNHPTYFIADLAANHDGDLQQAVALVHSAAQNGANAAKFQHFQAETIVSDFGFRSLGVQLSHQATWKKSVFEVYKNASLNLEWTKTLHAECRKAGITFFSSPYSTELVDAIEPFVAAYKIGSGDITWIEIVRYIASKGKPCLLATGAANSEDVVRAVEECLQVNPALCLMQCNTNYTGHRENFRHIQLNVLKTFKEMFPGLILGLSDHTPGHATALGAISLGARVIEKHYTLDKSRPGPDHGFSMSPSDWREMVDRSHELELALGTGVKRVEENERETVVLQRRAIRTRRAMKAGETIGIDDVEFLRPCPHDALPPWQKCLVLGMRLSRNLPAGECIRPRDVER